MSERSKGISLRLIGRDWFQSFKEKPKTHNQFEQSHRGIEQIIVNDFIEVRENEKNECAEHAPRGCNYAKDGQSSRDIIRLEPQPGAYGRGQSKERQTDIIVIESGAEMYSRQGLQLICLEDLQVI